MLLVFSSTAQSSILGNQIGECITEKRKRDISLIFPTITFCAKDAISGRRIFSQISVRYPLMYPTRYPLLCPPRYPNSVKIWVICVHLYKLRRQYIHYDIFRVSVTVSVNVLIFLYFLKELRLLTQLSMELQNKLAEKHPVYFLYCKIFVFSFVCSSNLCLIDTIFYRLLTNFMNNFKYQV